MTLIDYKRLFIFKFYHLMNTEDLIPDVFFSNLKTGEELKNLFKSIQKNVA